MASFIGDNNCWIRCILFLSVSFFSLALLCVTWRYIGVTILPLPLTIRSDTRPHVLRPVGWLIVLALLKGAESDAVLVLGENAQFLQAFYCLTQQSGVAIAQFDREEFVIVADDPTTPITILLSGEAQKMEPDPMLRVCQSA
jgi:hypothetical protein